MINRQTLLSDLRRILRQLETDLRQRCDELPEVDTALHGEYDAAKEAQRTAQSFEEWRSGTITQVAAAWVLSCVFARFLEDNQLVDPPRISGPGERLRRARDEYEIYFRKHPQHTYRDYLLDVFDRLGELPGGREIFGQHNPIHQQRGWLGGDAARTLLEFFQGIEPTTGELVHDFTDDKWDTRFLGDLYQDLSEDARKKYALLQTPEFVEEFILDRTLDPAIDEFGLDGFRMIDPACGSGHFLLGSFRRLFVRWLKAEPGTNTRVLAQRALTSVHGVDLNPYAVAIARFRLLLAALRSCGISRLADPFEINLACGDSLLHGTSNDQLVFGFDPLAHAYKSESLPELRRLLKAGHYHAVVANPPYITPRDKAVNEAYRRRYSACHRLYSLSIPFMQRIFNLATQKGYTGQLTANTFMKREFGKKVVDDFFPTVDLTHVIDTSTAHIPAHGTPTVILLGRNCVPTSQQVRTVMAIRGESQVPSDPARGLVWLAIRETVDTPGVASPYVTVADLPRQRFSKHPWSIGGGGACDLKEHLDKVCNRILDDLNVEVGFTCITKQDEVFSIPMTVIRHRRMERDHIRPFGFGDSLRDWHQTNRDWVVFPYDDCVTTVAESDIPNIIAFMWRYRTTLGNRKVFGGQTYHQACKPWYEFGQIQAKRVKQSPLIAFVLVATHSHFVVDRFGTIFNASTPVLTLPPQSNCAEYIHLAGLLSSSLTCFWLKQVLHDKGGGGIGGGIATESWERFKEFDSTKIRRLPLPNKMPKQLAVELEQVALELTQAILSGPFRAAVTLNGACDEKPDRFRSRCQDLRNSLITLQEELDWECYGFYGLTSDNLVCSDNLPTIMLGQRAFEIVMARKMAEGELETTWFERHGSTPITEIPNNWPDDYRRLVERRMELIENDRNIGLIEQPEYKRRWNTEPWESQFERALKNWLLDRLESYFDFDGRMNDEDKATARFGMEAVSAARIADTAARDSDFMQVAELFRGRKDFDVGRLVAELVEDESVPLLPVLCYKPAAMDKREAWERTWELQRQEDAIDARTKLPADDPEHLTEEQVRAEKRRLVGGIPVPPKYKSSDFQKSSYWRLRGKLDVPKERWASLPHCEGEDGSMVVAWAGYDHLQLTQAIGTYYAEVKEKGGTQDPRLIPLLACVLELVPWLKQWHNDIDPTYNLRMGDYYASFVEGEAREREMTVQQIREWQPPSRLRRRRRS